MEPKMLLHTFVAFSLLFGTVNAARILALVPTASRSHNIWNSALMLGLAKKGHQITALSPDPAKESNPNLKHIVLEGTYEQIQDTYDIESFVNASAIEMLQAMVEFSSEICKYELSTKGAKDLLQMPPDSFDLIITEVIFGECTFMYIHHFGGGTRIPVVGITAYGIGPWTDRITGSRTLPSTFALPILPYMSNMNFWERFHNSMMTGMYCFSMLYESYPQHQKNAEEAYGKPLPPLVDVYSNISLILVNNHYVINGPQAQLPGVINVGGMQCSPAKPLPQDIKSFLDGAKRGAIFFSLGTNVRSEFLPKEKLEIILDTFRGLGPDIRVLWKFDPEKPLENIPPNVLLKKWLPQEDVLGHPKIIAFASHTGLLSTQEAIYHGKPIIAIPFFADQHTNTRRLVDMKVAEHVVFTQLTKETFTKKIMKVIDDPSYKQRMEKMSQLLRDQPQTPLERAIFWIEFTLRQGKTGRVEALRSAGLGLNWYQYFLLDIFAVIFFSITMIIISAVFGIYVLYKCFRKIVGHKAEKVKPKKKKTK
ncbi:UDP-glucosyltransferase 2-like [Ischnura elegans]|uniref:UDP-glucosyltransferase 2-like n=1 Tax=Ischnura elegans TaxID=197161 RepID=UPI001ED86897|nr:UDP-glucosyltransferase 2-like [Ischnura elegans]